MGVYYASGFVMIASLVAFGYFFKKSIENSRVDMKKTLQMTEMSINAVARKYSIFPIFDEVGQRYRTRMWIAGGVFLASGFLGKMINP
jgi:hypothetical protein